MTGGEPDGEELLVSPRPLLSRPGRLVAALLLALGAGVGTAVAVWPDGDGGQPLAAATSSVPRAPQLSTSPAPSYTSRPVSPSTPAGRVRPWPTGIGACGSSSDLPIIRGARPLDVRTGITALVGNAGLVWVHLDTGRAEPTVGDFRPNEYVFQTAGAEPSYALAYRCDGNGSPRLLQLTRAGVTAIPISRRIETLITDGRRVWGVHWAFDDARPSLLVPVDGGPPVALPLGFVPAAVTDGVLVGAAARTASNDSQVLLVDADTGLVQRNLGEVQLLAVGDGAVVWTTGCAVDRPTSCAAHRQAVAGGVVDSYRLPRSPGFSYATMSADGRLLAFTMLRAGLDPRFRVDHPFPPSDVVVLHLDSGRVEIVPGIEVPAKSAPGLSFAKRDWLVIALAAGGRTRLLLWRPGQAHPYEARSVAGLSTSPPALLVAP